jgi:hypothetical protein
MLREINGQDVRVFVIWEPVLATDFTAPSTAALARIPDLRAAQYWDRNRALSHLPGEHNRSAGGSLRPHDFDAGQPDNADCLTLL